MKKKRSVHVDRGVNEINFFCENPQSHIFVGRIPHQIFLLKNFFHKNISNFGNFKPILTIEGILEDPNTGFTSAVKWSLKNDSGAIWSHVKIANYKISFYCLGKTGNYPNMRYLYR